MGGGAEQACFSFGTGPLAWSIIAFRNSLVFHSLDKVQATGASDLLLNPTHP